MRNNTSLLPGIRRTLTVLDIVLAFRYCPSGHFVMGSPGYERERNFDEISHNVHFKQGFWILETPVTQVMYKQIVGINPSFFSSGGGGIDKLNNFDTSNFPVESVSWNDCQNFVYKLNILLNWPKGMICRLPTESEWEYACRAGTTTPFSWGLELNGDKANCNGKYPYRVLSKGEYRGRTTEVGSYSPNPWGIVDMHGNVWEWCQDYYSDYDAVSQTSKMCRPIEAFRVLRGGGWDSGAAGCRAANRFYDKPTQRNNCYGFRFVIGCKYKDK